MELLLLQIVESLEGFRGAAVWFVVVRGHVHSGGTLRARTCGADVDVIRANGDRPSGCCLDWSHKRLAEHRLHAVR